MKLRILASLTLASVAASAADTKPLDITCFASAPTAETGSSVELRFYYRAPQGTKPEFVWTVKPGQGTIRTENGVTIWDLTNVDPDPDTRLATVNVTVDGVQKATCRTELLVVSKEAPATRSAGPVSSEGFYGFLVKGIEHQEDADYGLQSYLLLAQPLDTDAAEKARQKLIFDAVLKMLNPLASQLRGSRHSELNATWIPVKAPPPAGKDPDSTWLAANYDYPTAAGLLGRAHIQSTLHAAYIVSLARQLTVTVPKPPFLQINMTSVPGTIAPLWITMYLNQAAKPDPSTPNKMDNLVANFRLGIEILAEGLPAVKAAIPAAISYVKP
jgi:hypothetical protein